MPQYSTPSNPGSSLGVTTGSQVVMAANPYRRDFLITNDSDTVIYASLSGTAAAGSGYRLNPNGGFLGKDDHYGAVSAIHANKDALGNATTGATKNLCVVEN